MHINKMNIHCDICKMNVEQSEWNNHLDSNKHKRRLFRKLPKDYSPGEEYKPIYCDICKVNIEESEWNNHLGFKQT